MKLKTILKLLEAGGEEAGQIEIVETKASSAKKFFTNLIKNGGTNYNFDLFLETFEYNYNRARDMASKGYAKRADMPVIDSNQINKLQTHLEKGMIDIIDGKSGNFHKAFPQGLSGVQAGEWLKKGLYDGYTFDDVVDVSLEHIEVSTLTPLQEQIYFDKAISKLIKNGVESTIEFLQENSIIIVSKDGYIMDGHHRWLVAMLINPDLQIQTMVVDVEKDKLIKLLNTFSDAIGNTRNK